MAESLPDIEPYTVTTLRIGCPGCPAAERCVLVANAPVGMRLLANEAVQQLVEEGIPFSLQADTTLKINDQIIPHPFYTERVDNWEEMCESPCEDAYKAQLMERTGGVALALVAPDVPEASLVFPGQQPSEA